MKFAFVFVLGSFTLGGPPERADARDEWLARDKVKHFVVSAVIQGVGHSVLRANGSEYREAAWTAGAITLGAGVGKELWDRSRGRPFSWRDLGADAVGGGTGAVVIRQVAP
ncbi:MAG: hypothetical protein WD771_02840 [Gemmatimonadaceae bacterium]